MATGCCRWELGEETAEARRRHDDSRQPARAFATSSRPASASFAHPRAVDRPPARTAHWPIESSESRRGVLRTSHFARARVWRARAFASCEQKGELPGARAELSVPVLSSPNCRLPTYNTAENGEEGPPGALPRRRAPRRRQTPNAGGAVYPPHRRQRWRLRPGRQLLEEPLRAFGRSDPQRPPPHDCDGHDQDSPTCRAAPCPPLLATRPPCHRRARASRRYGEGEEGRRWMQRHPRESPLAPQRTSR